MDADVARHMALFPEEYPQPQQHQPSQGPAGSSGGSNPGGACAATIAAHQGGSPTARSAFSFQLSPSATDPGSNLSPAASADQAGTWPPCGSVGGSAAAEAADATGLAAALGGLGVGDAVDAPTGAAGWKADVRTVRSMRPPLVPPPTAAAQTAAGVLAAAEAAASGGTGVVPPEPFHNGGGASLSLDMMVGGWRGGWHWRIGGRLEGSMWRWQIRVNLSYREIVC